MPNVRIRDEWEPLVKQIIADLGPRTGPVRILGELKTRVKRLKASDAKVPSRLPSERTIQRIKDDLAPGELQEYERFHWPQSMESGALPWAAGRAALEFIGLMMDLNLHVRAQLRVATRKNEGLKNQLTNFLSAPPPTIRVIRWWWRLSQVAPGLPLGSSPFMHFEDLPPGYLLAYALAAYEETGSPQDLLPRVETYLSLAPWRGEDALLSYKYGVHSGAVPGLSEREIRLPLSYLLEAQGAVFGTQMAELMHESEEGREVIGRLMHFEEEDNGKAQE
jgi:hypothetical protein